MPAVRSVNKVIIVGNLTRDAELRHTTSGMPVCGFTVATNRMWVDSSGQRKEAASFHRISAWGKFAENLARILKKGMKVYIEGELRYNEKRDSDGKLLGRDASIRAEQVIILARPNNNQSNRNQNSNASADSSDDSLGLDQIAEELEEQAKEVEASEEEQKQDEEDDLPF